MLALIPAAVGSSGSSPSLMPGSSRDGSLLKEPYDTQKRPIPATSRDGSPLPFVFEVGDGRVMRALNGAVTQVRERE